MKFYINLFIATALLFFSLHVASWMGYVFLHPYFLHVVIFMFVLSAVSYMLVSLATKFNPESVMNAFMVTILIKLLFSAGFVFWYLYSFSENEISFVATFFGLYLFYSIFEIIGVLVLVKNSPKKEEVITNELSEEDKSYTES
jgi:hypothetical protein